MTKTCKSCNKSFKTYKGLKRHNKVHKRKANWVPQAVLDRGSGNLTHYNSFDDQEKDWGSIEEKEEELIQFCKDLTATAGFERETWLNKNISMWAGEKVLCEGVDTRDVMNQIQCDLFFSTHKVASSPEEIDRGLDWTTGNLGSRWKDTNLPNGELVRLAFYSQKHTPVMATTFKKAYGVDMRKYGIMVINPITKFLGLF